MRYQPCLLAVAVLLVTSACEGGGDSPVFTGASARATAGGSASSTTVEPSPSSAASTVERDRMIAAGSNLVTADLPGAASSPAQPDDAQVTAAKIMLATCLGVSPPQARASADSDDFTVGSGSSELQVSSSVDVVPTAAEARSDLAAFTSASAGKCLSDGLQSVLGGSGPTGATVTSIVVQVPVPPGADGAFGFRYAITIGGEDGVRHLAAEEAGVLIGRAEIDLTSLGAGSPLPAAERNRLLQALTTRSAVAQR